MAYNRYNRVSLSGRVELLPNIKIPSKKTDKFEEYLSGVTRFDLLSNKYYRSTDYDWLILLANPELVALEFEIDNGYLLRIPYPLESTLDQFENSLDNYITLYGFN